jgi:signal-transduction protein with cAMP-binding, CBS, and nucleotidyltransferase domain
MVGDPNRDIDADRGKYAGIHSREIDREVSVAEAMNKSVIVMDINSDAPAIAREMIDRGAGSIIIIQNNMAMGIVTERDLVRGIVTEDRRPGEVKASELLSTPIITIEPEKSIAEASKVMLKANIKRLPVLKDRTVIGVISNTDILMVTPGLNTILRDLIDMNREALLSIPSIEEISDFEDFRTGICESCEVFSIDLRYVDGRYLCENCRQEEGEDYE